ncbi:hypothetical protein [Hydrogenimonas sp.]
MRRKLLPALLLMPMLAFATYFSEGMRAYKQGDYITAKASFERAIKQEGSKQANFFLGILYLKGLGVKQNIQTAKRFLAEAVKIGNMRAKCYLAEAYLLQKNPNKKMAIKLLKEGNGAGATECAAIAAKYKIPL